MAEFEYDFSGWATKNGIKCSDGRTIERDAFVENHGKTVPLVWQHNHDEVYNVIGHALLENRKEGVYAYCSLNDSDMAEHARSCVKHRDLQALSIYAKVNKEVNKHVMHGKIKELSLVLSPANPGAIIDNVVMHSDDGTYDAEMYYSDEENETWSAMPGVVDLSELSHSDEEEPEEPKAEDKSEPTDDSTTEETIEHSEEGKEMATETTNKEKTVEDVLNELTPEQSKVVEYVIGEAVKAALDNAVQHSEEENDMRSIFENNAPVERPQIAPEDVKDILAHAAQSSCGSLRTAVQDYLGAVNEYEGTLAHADDNPGGVERSDTTGVTYGIAGIDWLFPNAHNLYNEPDFLKRRTEWVSVVMTGVKDVPWARIKSMFTDITGDAARAKGYTKGNRKVEEVVSLLRRETAPFTIYKKQKLDRDDIIDITDFNVVTYLKGEMRLMWEEELARAILVGDGRDPVSQLADKIDETKIRPIYTDDPLFSVPERVEIPYGATDDQRTKLIIRKIIKAQDDYEGSGNPTLFTTQSFVSDCLLLEDGMGRPMYDNLEKLKTALRVSRIVTVPVMKDLSRVVEIDHVDTTFYLDAIIVNLSDYSRGADKGGKAEMFEDFDIDYNQYKYLYEGRCSGALTKPYSALIVEHNIGAAPEPSNNVEQPAG